MSRFATSSNSTPRATSLVEKNSALSSLERVECTPSAATTAFGDSSTSSPWWLNRQLQDRFELAQNEKLKKYIQRLKAAAERTSAWSDKVEKTKRAANNSGLKPDTGYIGHKAAKMARRSKSMDNRRQAAVEEKSRLLKNLEETESLKLSPLPFYTGRFAELDSVSVLYGDRAVCEHVGFTVERGDRIALVGKNGSGKSSLLKLICGEPLQYRGTLRRSSRLTVSYVPQGTAELCGSLTEYARQYGLDESLLKAILRKLDFSRAQFDKDMALYSGGQKKKVLLARSLCEKAHLYIWDEPLNYIDVFSRVQIEELLLAYKPTLLCVEHDQAFCQNIATKTVRL
jgi:lincosamide and streptogramin A transport system ATP-binding/permease protein